MYAPRLFCGRYRCYERFNQLDEKKFEKMLPNLTLVLGGAASGKSLYSEQIINLTDAPKVYIATAQPFDSEMQAKIAQHKIQRGEGWITLEEPVAVAATLMSQPADHVVLVDCATLWLTNVLLADHDDAAMSDALCNALVTCHARVVVVSNEVGQGIVPENALSRKFRNAQGKLNRMIAAEADCVVAVMAGLPLALKGDLPA